MTVLISRNGHGGCRCRFRGLLVPLAPLPLMRCGGRGWCVGRMGDYQIAPKRPEGGFGRWRLTPPGMGGTACGRGRGVLRRCAATPHPSRLRRATCLPAGRSVRGSDTPPACHSTPRTPRGEGFGRVAFSTAPLKGKANEDVSFDDISLANGWYADLLCRHLDIPVAFRDTFW